MIPGGERVTVGDDVVDAAYGVPVAAALQISAADEVFISRWREIIVVVECETMVVTDTAVFDECDVVCLWVFGDQPPGYWVDDRRYMREEPGCGDCKHILAGVCCSVRADSIRHQHARQGRRCCDYCLVREYVKCGCCWHFIYHLDGRGGCRSRRDC